MKRCYWLVLNWYLILVATCHYLRLYSPWTCNLRTLMNPTEVGLAVGHHILPVIFRRAPRIGLKRACRILFVLIPSSRFPAVYAQKYLLCARRVPNEKKLLFFLSTLPLPWLLYLRGLLPGGHGWNRAQGTLRSRTALPRLPRALVC